jgi:5'-3' exonuclease
MGINDFSKVFGQSSTVKLKDIKSSFIIVDAMLEIHRTCLGMRKITTLTDSHGRPTGYIQALYQMIISIIKNGNYQIWCFDSPEAKPLKQLTIKKRNDIRDNAKIQEEDESDEEKKEDLKKRSFRITPEMINNIKFILRSLGMGYIDAPPSYEAEHLCSEIAKRLTSKGKTAYVVSSDTDSLLYGAPLLLRKVPRKTGVYNLYDLGAILDEKKITQEDIVEVGVTLGCDICPSGKVKGIGPATVLGRVRKGDIEFDEDQLAAKARFLSKCPVGPLTKSRATKKSLDALNEWLVSERDFSSEKVKKALSFMYEKVGNSN